MTGHCQNPEARKQFIDGLVQDMSHTLNMDLFRAQLIVLRGFEASDAAQVKIKEIIQQFSDDRDQAMCLAIAMSNLSSARDEMVALSLDAMNGKGI